MTDDRGQIGFVLRVFPSVCPLSSVVCPLVGEVGLEPTKAKPADLQFHFGRFSKSLKTLERVKGIEPSSSAWKAVALPLSYTRTRAVLSHRSSVAQVSDD